MRRIMVALVIGLLVAGAAYAGGGAEEAVEEEVTFRVASGSQGPAVREAFDAVVEEFENRNPGVTVDWDRSTGADYEFTGLPSLLESGTPPDVFFEWGGHRVVAHVEDGQLMDISDLADELRPVINESAWDGAVVDGRTYMIPDNQDITIMMWYNQDIFDRYGLSPPETQEEFMQVGEALLDEGITPIVMGNAGAWVAGNFGGVFLSRWAGDDYYHEVLSLEPGTRFNNERFVQALEFAHELGERGFVNEDMNTLGYEESFIRLINEQAAMMPMGTWFVNQIAEFAADPDDLNFNYFDLPPFEGGRGHPRSVMGLNTGYVVNANTEHPELAYDFLRTMMEREFQLQFITEAGRISTNIEAMRAVDDPYIQAVATTLDRTPVLISPPDTGYELEAAHALYEAIAKAFEGIDPQVALDETEAAVRHLRDE